MQLHFQPNVIQNDGTHNSWKTQCLVFFVFDGQDGLAGSEHLLEKAPWVAISPAWRDFNGKSGKNVMLYGHPDTLISRVLLVGLGKADKLVPGSFRNATASALKRCRELNLADIAFSAENMDALCIFFAQQSKAKTFVPTRDILLEEAVMASFIASYTISGYHCKTDKEAESKREEERRNPERIEIFFPESSVPDTAKNATRKAEAIATGIFQARDLVNGPANIITPTYIANHVAKIAKQYGFKYELLNVREIREQGMGAFWAVAQGAVEEPCLIVLEHCPKGMENEDPIVFIGKGITFDTGGISLKPPTKMHEMKSDMAGAAAVLGVFCAIGESLSGDNTLNLLKRRVVAIIPCTENMPDGNATRPGDIVTSLSGKTIEINNTDAEGRLILCDSITFAQKRWKPRLLLDIATLTGACVMALGDDAAGVFSTSPALASYITAQGEKIGERFWPLPLWADQTDKLKSPVADLVNIGPREGGALWAAMFLKQFVEDGITWVHLDIAGPAYIAAQSALHPGGGTGFGVRTMCELIFADPASLPANSTEV